MNIGIIIPQSKFFGGGPHLALELGQQLKKLGHVITVYTFHHAEDPDGTYNTLLRGIKLVSLPPETKRGKSNFWTRLPLPGMSTLTTYFDDHHRAQMLAALIDPHTEALLPQSNRVSVLTAYYFKKRVKKVPAVWQMNDLVTYTHKRCYVESWTENSCSPFARFVWGTLDWIDRKYLPAIDEISVLSHIIEGQARRGLNRKATVLRSGVNAEHFTYRKRQAPHKRRITLLSHAQFFRHRRFENVVSALGILVKRGYDVELILSGDSNTYRPYRAYRDELKNLAESLGVDDRLHIPGRVTEERLLNEFHTSDIFVFADFKQSWGLVPFEAMATGLPVVASDEAGASEVLTNNENALIAAAREPAAIADAVARLIDNPELYEKISSNGAVFVRTDITWEKFAKNTLALVEKHRNTNRDVKPA